MSATASDIKLTLHAEIKERRINFNKSELERLFDIFDGKHVHFEVTVHRNKKSVQQNKYYWGAIIPFVQKIFADAGENMRNVEVHYVLSAQFLPEKPPVVNPLTGEVSTVRYRYSELTTKGFSAYFDAIGAFVLETTGLVLPAPEDLLQLDEKRHYINGK